jgi:hypothetical protein
VYRFLQSKRESGVTHNSEHFLMELQRESPTFLNIAEPLQEKHDLNYELIAALIQDLRFNVEGKVQKRDVESALQILFWPTDENVWDKAEAICMEKAKEVFSQILKGDEDSQSPVPNLKDCLQVLVYLGEMREGACR